MRLLSHLNPLKPILDRLDRIEDELSSIAPLVRQQHNMTRERVNALGDQNDKQHRVTRQLIDDLHGKQFDLLQEVKAKTDQWVE